METLTRLYAESDTELRHEIPQGGVICGLILPSYGYGLGPFGSLLLDLSPPEGTAQQLK